ncbi:Myogenesis-regulating glycosidase [Eumeta japonica]|uniref:Myogenesis-regulating glycosidase n=1 Tax=Eumeta variegata TaxID=151549 RepID=A0A4C1TYL5_EUMVA|nr:Myogenesis-regulating glycosidase [Eumeta japonica]
MIGGNGFNLDHDTAALPDKELFIRWVQANTFLPAMQYSFVPWEFDNETAEISKKYTELHSAHAGDIYEAILASVETGQPVNAPLWWADPYDEQALGIWDEFLLGERILVAPVFNEGAVSRDIYLPAGVWYAEGDEEQAYEGPIWLTDYPAPLDTLPYFIKEGEPDSARAEKVAAILILLSVFVNMIF